MHSTVVLVRKFWFKVLVGSFSVILLSCGIFFSNSIAHAYDLATTHSTESFSELYFDNVSKLPLYSPAGKIQHFKFHITNHKGAPKVYVYQLTEITEGNQTIFTSKNITLKDGQGIDIPFTFSIPTPNSSTQITVQLIGMSQKIEMVSKS